MSAAFLDRYSKVFGRPAAMMLRIAGLTASECTGQGAVVTDETGRDWLDFGSFGIHLLGHCHPHVQAAAAAQLPRLNLSTKILANAPALDAAERLGRLTFGTAPAGVLYGNSGSEAVEIAIRMARLATGRARFVALERAYHGRTDGALGLSASYARHAGAPARGDTVFVAPGDTPALEAALAKGEIAAVFVEPIQGEGGIHALPAGFLGEVRRLCDAHGSLMIADEIQTGLGRAGALVSCPMADAVIFGKTLAGGIVPVSAVVFRAERFGARARDPIASASSYAGGALAGAVAGAVLDVVNGPGFLARVDTLGRRMRDGLSARIGGHPGIREIRGHGLMIGLECVDPHLSGEIVLEAAARDLLISFCLSAPAVLRVYPPAVATEAEVDTALTRLAEALDTAWARIRPPAKTPAPSPQT